MKLVFSTLDTIYMVGEVAVRAIGSRVNNVYDINNKTYLLKLTKNEDKFVLLLESGARFHFTEFNWAKNVMPSGFSMKLRKHIKNRKITSITQLGADRIVDITIGSDVNAFHLIVELYDKGNMIFTDFNYIILHLLRPRTDANQDIRYATHEKYPIENVRQLPQCLREIQDVQSLGSIQNYVLTALSDSKGSCSSQNSIQALRSAQKALTSEFNFGQASIDHCCRLAYKAVQSSASTSAQVFPNREETHELTQDLKEMFALRFATELRSLLLHAYHIDMHDDESLACGYVFGRKHQHDDEELLTQDDFHPFLFDQLRTKAYLTFPSFSKAVDHYFSKIENQKMNNLLVQNETKSQKKLQNIKRDHELRLSALKSEQEYDVRKAQLLESNQQLVDNIILMINHALSNQVDWRQLEHIVEEARERGDVLAAHIVQLSLHTNQLTLRLSDPFQDESGSEEATQPATSVDIVVDLDMNALNNARKYYDRKRAAARKEERTVTASRKALKSAAHKADQIRKDVKTVTQISKVRKPMWFEKFFWFISSENYLVVAGRDAQQNEALVKRHLGPNDVYVHADLHGASSVIVKARPLLPDESPSDAASTENPESTQETTHLPLPPLRTLAEAGTMAITLSSAWDARVVTSAWWVRPDQVSKTAPSGEYLTTGAFMIRGRKTYLPPCHLIYGFGILFKLDDDSVMRHQGERRITKAVVEHVVDSIMPSQISDPIPSASNLSDVEGSTMDTPDFPDTQLQLDISKLSTKFQSKCELQPADVTIARSRGKIPPLRTVKHPKPTPQTVPPHSNGISEPDVPKMQLDVPGSVGGPLKRGQKSKVRKIKQKYSEQDEDERQMRMKLLQGEKAKLSQHHDRLMSHLSVPPTEPVVENNVSVDMDTNAQQVISEEKIISEEAVSEPSVTDDYENPIPPSTNSPLPSYHAEEDEETRPFADNDWLRIMDTFTGQPLEDDVLLYALPVCAPYSALADYKFKAKLTPGTLKRGKATKTLLNHFVTHKSATKREQELLRVLRGEDVSRNFPGCVKISLPQDNANRHH